MSMSKTQFLIDILSLRPVLQEASPEPMDL